MSGIYIFILVVLVLLAVSGLTVGVTNDAVNFLNSAIGSKAAPRKVILSVAAVGIMIGALTSSGMMEVARSGVFHPEAFTFNDVMMLFLGVMFANVILLDLFNSLGMPTSTTVSLVFGLLGAAIAVATVRISQDPTLTLSSLSQFINSGKALAIVGGILASVAIAFVSGTIVMFISRLVFTFDYEKLFRRFGSLWCGIAFTVIIYFALFKGLKSSGVISADFYAMVENNLGLSIFATWAACSVLMFLLQRVGVNILKITILAGTFSLALAFAGNDLVNFIGVPIAGIDSYNIIRSMGGTEDTMMGMLSEPVKANYIYLVIAGVIMVITLFTSKKTQKVSETEINLASQDEGPERFGSTAVSRAIVRAAMNMNNWYIRNAPEKMQEAINKRFMPSKVSRENKANFDMVRASVNLTTASILIVLATSLKLPLSTTYVTFMVAMGSSLADKAWGRESAVYRITGVFTVISGWFMTALIAFLIALVVTYLLLWGGTIAIILITLLCGFLLFRDTIRKKRNEGKEEQKAQENIFSNEEGVVPALIAEISHTMEETTNIYKQTIEATLAEDRSQLRSLVRRANDLFYVARERKYEVMPAIQKLEKNYINTGHYYVQVVDYMSEMTKALVHITRPCFEHIDNNHRGMSEEQVEDLLMINKEVAKIYASINNMLKTNEFGDLDEVLTMRDNLFEMIADAIKNQLRRIKTKSTSTKASMLYLNILNETKTMVLQSRNLIKSQKYFIESQK
ncbi:MAG: inorganic phosphate transporter [Tidjanibacter sp.]|nr:inorganic phosphate transporter [Tidjanibacter sp.]